MCVFYEDLCWFHVLWLKILLFPVDYYCFVLQHGMALGFCHCVLWGPYSCYSHGSSAADLGVLEKGFLFLVMNPTTCHSKLALYLQILLILKEPFQVIIYWKNPWMCLPCLNSYLVWLLPGSPDPWYTMFFSPLWAQWSYYSHLCVLCFLLTQDLGTFSFSTCNFMPQPCCLCLLKYWALPRCPIWYQSTMSLSLKAFIIFAHIGVFIDFGLSPLHCGQRPYLLLLNWSCTVCGIWWLLNQHLRSQWMNMIQQQARG